MVSEGDGTFHCVYLPIRETIWYVCTTGKFFSLFCRLFIDDLMLLLLIMIMIKGRFQFEDSFDRQIMLFFQIVIELIIDQK